MSITKKTAIISLIIIAVAFYGGLRYGRSGTSSIGSNNRSFSGQGGLTRRSFNNSGGVIRGDIIKKDSQSVVVALPVGGSQIIWYSTSTQVQKTIAATVDDLSIGQTVMINGSANSDGSLSANSIQLR